MQLDDSVSIGRLAEEAGRVIRERLANLGSPDLPHDIEVVGDPETLVGSICPVESIEPGCLTFAIGKKYLEQVEASNAAAVITPPHLVPESKPYIKAPEPRLVFSVIMELVGPNRDPVPALSDGVRYKDRSTVKIGDGSIIGDWCYIGANVSIGAGCRIYPHVFIDDNVTMGDGCIVYPHVSIFRDTQMGREVIIHSGAIIGDDGFGYNQLPDLQQGRLRHMKNSHFGGVVIGDSVEVGSQVCIDRGLAENTVIGPGTKIDNLAQIAHNCRIGADCIIVSQVGMSGHTVLGDRVFALGQAGFAPGVRVGNDAIITGRAGVTRDIPDGPALWSGVPARKSDEEYKQRALARRQLPRVREFFRIFKKAGSFEELKNEFFAKKAGSSTEDK